MRAQTLVWIAMVALALGSAACGFDCKVQGDTRPFSGCDALQEAYDAEQSSLDPPPNGAVLDDLQTCGEAQGCDIQ